MKSNRMMRFASIILVLTLISACAISGTFAKYTTSASGTDTATVASWGFGTSTIVLTDLFKNSYTTTGGTSADVSATSDVIAPGTKGEVEFAFNSPSTAPQVAYSFTVDTTGSECGSSLAANTALKWKLDGTKVGTSGTFAELLTAIEALSGNASGKSKNYAPGTLPTAFPGTSAENNKHKVSWEWEFEATDNDDDDTALGDAATLDTVKLVISITATQLDSYTAN